MNDATEVLVEAPRAGQGEGSESGGPDHTRDFVPVLEAELRRIGQQRGERGVAPDAPLVGLALSGGGIRSSTFALGVLQALHDRGCFRRLDYLSSVSGGGFVATALGWFQRMNGGRFPFGDRPPPDPLREESQGPRVTEFLRLHADYLDQRMPPSGGGSREGAGGSLRRDPRGQSFSLFALLSVVGQQMAVTLFVYGGLLVFLFFLLQSVDALLRPVKVILALQFVAPPTAPRLASIPILVLVGLGLLGLYVAMALWYSLRFYLASRGRDPGSAGRTLEREYGLRIGMERRVALVLGAGLLALAVGSAPVVAELLGAWIEERWVRGGLLGGLATAGGLLGWIQNRAAHPPSSGGSRGREAPAQAVLLSGPALRITAVGTLYALTMTAATLALLIADSTVVGLAGVLLVGVLLVGFLSDVNALGSHRMYRDRLMETFMPDPESVRTGQWAPSTAATRTPLADAGGPTGPYPLYNTALLTTGSARPECSGRGADSFVLAPLYSGSRATGWRRTDRWPRRPLTWPTAMAVSAAAVNPGAGFAGQGPTRTWSVATLLALLNLRLGYWTENPDPERAPRSRGARPGLLVPGRFPVVLQRSFPFLRLRAPLHPTLLPAPLGSPASEETPWIQLADGGDFDSMGIYELIRRQVDVIFVSDATGDERYTFQAMGDILGRIRTDFGVTVDFPTEGEGVGALRPGSSEMAAGPDGRVFSARAHSIGRIHYPARGKEPAKQGALILLKAALVEGLPLEVLTYRAASPDFPNESTLNQFFGERQFEAYRQLGLYTGLKMLEDPAVRELVGEPLP